MQPVALCLAFFAFLATYEAVSAQQAFAYNVTVKMGDKKDSQDGKLKIVLAGNNFKYLVPLSAQEETFKKNSVYTYLVAAPHEVNSIEKVLLTWTRKKKVTDPSTWFSSPKIYVEKVIVDPIYIQNINIRRSATKSFCAAKENTSIKVEEEISFRFKC